MQNIFDLKLDEASSENVYFIKEVMLPKLISTLFIG